MESAWGCPPPLVAEQAGDQLRRGLAVARMDSVRGGGGPRAHLLERNIPTLDGAGHFDMLAPRSEYWKRIEARFLELLR